MKDYKVLYNFTETITLVDTPTGAGQIYPKKKLIDAFDIYMSKDKQYRTGCFDEPTGIINEKNISHFLLDWWINDNKLIGQVEIIDTVMGNTFMDLKNLGTPMTLGLAAMATFESTLKESRNLFGDYSGIEDYSKTIDQMAVQTTYLTLKSETTH